MKILTLADISDIRRITFQATGYDPPPENLRHIFLTGGEGIASDCMSAFLLLDFVFKDHTPTAHIAAIPEFRGRRFVGFIMEGMEYARQLGYREVYSHQPKENYNRGLRLLVGALGGQIVSRETDPERIYRIDL